MIFFFFFYFFLGEKIPIYLFFRTYKRSKILITSPFFFNHEIIVFFKIHFIFGIFLENGMIFIQKNSVIICSLSRAKFVTTVVKLGSLGFRQFYGHDCLGKSYSPGEAAGFIKFCIKCHSFFDSITEMVFHNVDHHHRLPSVRCVSIGCGRSYFNDQAHDLHILRLHGGWFNFNSALKKMYGPRPSCF